MIRVNRQVHLEIFDAFCFRTWTRIILWEGPWFLGRRYCNSDESNEHQIDAALFDLLEFQNLFIQIPQSGFPISIPFHLIMQLSIHVRTNISPIAGPGWLFGMTVPGKPWQPLRGNIQALGRLLKHITCRHPSYAKLLLKVNDVPEPGYGPSEQRPHSPTWFFSSVGPLKDSRDIRYLLEPLETNVHNFQRCELRLGDWIKNHGEVTTLAQKCGCAMLQRSGASRTKEHVPKREIAAKMRVFTYVAVFRRTCENRR